MTESFFQFQSPGWFILLALLPFVFFYEMRKLRLLRLPLSNRGVLAGRPRTPRAVLEFAPPLFKTVAMGLIVTALARPQIANLNTEVKSEGVDIVLALDTSGSMRALDLELGGRQTDRITVVKDVVRDFITGRAHDRIGMVVFGEEAYTQCPLTLDYDILAGYLELIEVGIAGDATAIGNALAVSVKRLKDSRADSRVVILLTDGANNAGEVSPLVAGELAKDAGIKVYTIAVGSNSPTVPLPVQTPFGMQVRNVEAVMDEELLKHLAEATGGRYFRADSTETLRRVYDTIDGLEKTEVKMERFAEYQELYLDWLFPALALLVAGWGLRHTYFLRVP